MKVSREQAAANRERILDEAARLFRERGFNGIGVADVMKSAGLTHGGFYGHFSSKEDLIAQVCQRAASTMIETWKRAADDYAADPLAAIALPYLSTAHRDRSGTGCLIAALGPEVSRQAAPVRHAVTEGVRSALDDTGSAHADKVVGSEAEEGHRDVCRHGRRPGHCARRE